MKRNNVHALRLILAVLVIYSHSYPLFEGNEDREPLYWLTGHLTIGRVAVDCFFILSGFLITASWDRSKSVTDFLIRRVGRIYPGFIIANAFGCYLLAFVFSNYSNGFVPYNFWDFSRETFWLMGSPTVDSLRLRDTPLVGIFDSNPNRAVNGSLWTIRYEFFCYVGTVFMGLAFGRKSWLMVVVYVASILVAFSFIYFSLRWFSGGFVGRFFGQPYLWARLLPCYMSGAVAWRFREQIHIAPTAMIYCGIVVISTSQIPSLWAGMFPVAGSYLLLTLAFTQPTRLFDQLEQLGDFSYGTYLYAFPVQQSIVRVAGHFIPCPMMFFLIATVAVLPIAAMSWFLIERPILKLIRSGK